MKPSKKMLASLLILQGCASVNPASDRVGTILSAHEFSKQLRTNQPLEDIKLSYDHPQKEASPAALNQAPVVTPAGAVFDPKSGYQGDAWYLNQGFSLKQTYGEAPKPGEMLAHAQPQQVTNDGGFAVHQVNAVPQQNPHPPYPTNYPTGSRSPYYLGQMTDNPSLWPDDAHAAFLFTDFRAFQAMDVITVIINEDSQGKKKADTDTEGKFSLSAGISKLFGIEEKKWKANNTALDPTALINATTDTKFEGEGETGRSGELTARISSVIMEVLPNGLLRVEGTKIVAVNSEEEVMVLSGLIRPRDINADNQVTSDRIANMRIDYYGRGVIADQQSPGWGSRIFEMIWPF